MSAKVTLHHYGKVEPAPVGLIQRGPIVGVHVGPATMEVGDGSRLSGPHHVMIDTGAERTLLDEELCKSLGIPPIRYEWVIGIAAARIMCPVYRIGISLGMTLDARPDTSKRLAGLITFASDVIGMPRNEKAIHMGLLGRDFLANFHLAYNGPGAEFVLSWKDASLATIPAHLRPKKPRPKRKKPKRRR